jgi:hypothetical protein
VTAAAILSPQTVTTLAQQAQSVVQMRAIRTSFGFVNLTSAA